MLPEHFLLQSIQNFFIPGLPLSPYVVVAANILQFWWIPAPFILYGILRPIFVLYMGTKWNLTPDHRRVTFEIRLPQKVTQPLRSMENFFSAFWTSYDPPKDWREQFFGGKTLMGTSFEMASIEGVPHFFIWTPASNKNHLLASIYGHYPEVEVVEVPDYTQMVPQDVPNKDWDVWGCDFVLYKSDVYPIKTYEDFFEERPDVAEEEKRLDPLATIMELFGNAGKNEHLWFQIFATPIMPKENNYPARAKKEIEYKLLKRKQEPKSGQVTFFNIILDYLNWIVTGVLSDSKEEEKQNQFAFDFLMSPGERKVVEKVERKAAKVGWEVFMRYVYVARRDSYDSGCPAYGPSYTAQFGTHNLNGIKPSGKTITKVQSPNYFKKARLHIKKRNVFYYYKEREPNPADPATKFVMGTDELATMYHFPGLDVVSTPALQRIEITKSAPPTTLPVED